MAKDDRFTLIAGTLAVLITVGLFFWSHWGSLTVSTRSDNQAAAFEIVNLADGSASAAENNKDQEEPEFVAAVYEIETVDSRPEVTANNGDLWSDDGTLEVLEGLACQWTGAPLPADSEVTVRKDRDGRMVVANGTHRRYQALRNAIDTLDLQAVEDALQQAVGRDSLRNDLTAALDETLSIEVPDVEPDMVAGVHAWKFADPEYQHLSTGPKHLLLMGRNNATVVRSKLVEIRRLLGGPEIAEYFERPDLQPDPVIIAETLETSPPDATPIEP